MIGELPPLAKLQVLKVYSVEDLAAVLIKGTDLRWLEVAENSCKGYYPCVAFPQQDVAGVGPSKLQVLSIEFDRPWTEGHDCPPYLHIMGNMSMPKLKWLKLTDWPCAELPATVIKAKSLLMLDLAGALVLKRLPRELGNLENLRCLNLSSCSGLLELPDSITDLRWLEYLSLSLCTSIKKLPASLGKLQRLVALNLSICADLQGLPESFTQLQQLQVLDISHCSSIRSLPASLGDLPLKIFDYTSSVEIPPEWIMKWKNSGKLLVCACWAW
jgi:hypothetical protein